MQLTVVPHEESVFTIQKSSLSQWTVFGEQHPENSSNNGKYALIPLSECTFCVCKLFFQRDIHPSFIYLDKSVVHFLSDNSNSMPKFPVSLNDGCVYDNKIIILPTVVYFKKISLTVIVESIKDIPKWRREKEKLQALVSEILKMYVVTKDSVVFLRNLKEGLRHGLYALSVHSCDHPSTHIVPGQVTSQCEVAVVRVISKLRFEQSLEQSSVPKMGGLDETRFLLKDIIQTNIKYKNSQNDFSLKPTRQVLLTGPPGCGKTSIVKQVAAECGATLLTVLGSENTSSKPGASEEALRNIFNDASILAEEHEDGVCVLLLDEVDALCSHRDSSNNSSHSLRATVQFLTLLDQADATPGLVVIATTSKVKNLDPSVRRPGRLETEVFISVPTQSQRESIMQVLLRDMLIDVSEVDYISQFVARITPGYVGADLALVCQEVSLGRNRRCSNEDPPLNSLCSAFKRAVGKIKPSALRSGLGVVLSTPSNMDAIGGLQSVKNELRVAIEWPLTHPDAFTRMGLPQPKGLLLYGPPGCAKTSIAKALASATNTTFLSVSSADLFSPYVGEAEQTVSELFSRARAGAPTILFIDEIDALVGCRGDKGAGAQERVLSVFLTEMDGVGIKLEGLKADNIEKSLLEGASDVTQVEEVRLKESKNCVKNVGVIVIAATNRPDMIDSALLRPGRFDKLLYVPPPDEKERLEILKCVTRNTPVDKSVDFEHIAKRTSYFSGADLTNLCKEAALSALSVDGMSVTMLSQKHFEAALQCTRPSLTQEQVVWYEDFKRSM